MDLNEIFIGKKQIIPTDKQNLFLYSTKVINVMSRLTRQQGYSTAQCLSMIALASENKDQSVMIVCPNNQRAAMLLDTIARIVDASDIFVKSITKGRIKFNDSTILISSLDNCIMSSKGLPNVTIYLEGYLNKRTLQKIHTLYKYTQYNNIKIHMGLMCNEYKLTYKFKEQRNAFMMDFLQTGTLVDFPSIGYSYQHLHLSPEQLKQEFELFDF
jgi:hypothetical protein